MFLSSLFDLSQRSRAPSCWLSLVLSLRFMLVYQSLLQIYVKQQSDLQFLNFNVENSQELIQIYSSKVEEAKALESR